jgi:hypothetical protein
MGLRSCIVALVINIVAIVASADSAEWRKYVIPSTGAKVDIPVSIFTEDAGAPDGGVAGRRFFTQDHRANLTLQSVANPENDSPAAFLAKTTSSRRHPVQTGHSTFLRSVQHPQWANLVQSL